MANDPIRDKVDPSDPDSEQNEIVVSPPRDPAIVSDTINTALDSGNVAASQVVDTEGLNAKGFSYIKQRQQTKVHIGPLPDPQTIRELTEIYSGAAKILFDEFKAQSAHRREMERAVITTNNTLAVRGQIVGGILGGIGLIGSLIVAGLGQGWAGFGIAVSSLVSLVSVFVLGREAQKKEREEKEKLRQRIKQGESIEDLEKTGPAVAQQPDRPHEE